MTIKIVPLRRGLRSDRPGERGVTLPLALGRPTELLAKRVIDVTAAVTALVLLAPVMLAVAIAIRLDSPGPVLFRQRRVGRGGRPFTFLKFRSMRTDAEALLGTLEARNEAPGGVLFKIRDDPRLTGIGSFLRRTSLDELPQLINVIRGEMSLVGPRPLQLRDSEKLQDLDRVAHERRLMVLPGLSGPWQVGGRSDADSGRMVELDLDYVDNWSLGRDLVILCRTFSAVLGGRGAY